MVKQKSSRNLDRNMNTYKMRTSYSGSTNNSQINPPNYNHVQVAHSNGCCSSKQTQHVVAPRQQQPSVIKQQYDKPRPTAHEISHLKLDSPDPFYYRHGRIKKTPHRLKKSSQQSSSTYRRNQIHTTEQTTNQIYQPVQVTTQKKSSCCTIL